MMAGYVPRIPAGGPPRGCSLVSPYYFEPDVLLGFDVTRVEQPIRLSRPHPDDPHVATMMDNFKPPRYQSVPDGQPATDNQVAGAPIKRRLFKRKGVSNG